MKKLSHIILALVLFLLPAVVNYQKTSALSGGDFNPGRIIDDSIFYNPNSMTSQDIQNFLASKVPSCDTNGAKPSSANPSLTRAQWAAQTGNPAPPYTCLRNYSQSVPSMPADAYCPGTVSAGVKSAASIIKDVANACSINPQTLLVLLQKEQSLITDDWPWPRQYEAATGFSCPDTAPCDPEFAGFFYQIYYGARQFQRYVKQASSFNYQAGRTSYILYNPNTGCGGTNVYIQNPATAALYNYTPYQPNTAALNNLYGTGDGCSAYGNRNFWRLFNDWFGTTLSSRPTANVDWKFENLDGGTSGLRPSSNTIGINPKTITFNNDLYIFYYDSTSRTLRMAKATSSGWSHEVLDGNTTVNGRIVADVGRATTAVIYNGMLHIYYYNSTGQSLRHAWLASGTWNFETLDGSSGSVSGKVANVGMSNAAIDFDGSMQLFYYDATNTNLRHATYSIANGWRFRNLDGDPGSTAGLNSNLGQNPTVTTYGGSLQLFYFDVSNGNLRHAWVNPGQAWKFENLDGDPGSIARRDGFVGQDPTVTTHGGSLQLFYFDVSNGNLRHAWVNPGQAWKFENLDGDPGSIGRNNSNLGSMSTSISFNNVLYVFYRDNSSGILRYGWADTGGWHFTPLEGAPYSISGLQSNTGFWPTVTSYGSSLQLYYFDNDQRALRHTFGNPYW